MGHDENLLLLYRESQIFDLRFPPVRMGSVSKAASSAFIRELFQITLTPGPHSRLPQCHTSDSGSVLTASALLKLLQGRFDAQFRLRSTFARCFTLVLNRILN